MLFASSASAEARAASTPDRCSIRSRKDPVTAAESLRMLRPRVAIPIHWGTYTPIGAPRLWPWLTTDAGHRFAQEAARVAPEVEVRVLNVGESLVVA